MSEKSVTVRGRSTTERRGRETRKRVEEESRGRDECFDDDARGQFDGSLRSEEDLTKSLLETIRSALEIRGLELVLPPTDKVMPRRPKKARTKAINEKKIKLGHLIRDGQFQICGNCGKPTIINHAEGRKKTRSRVYCKE